MDKEGKWNLMQSGILPLTKNTGDSRKVCHKERIFDLVPSAINGEKKKHELKNYFSLSLPFTSSLSQTFIFSIFPRRFGYKGFPKLYGQQQKPFYLKPESFLLFTFL